MDINIELNIQFANPISLDVTPDELALIETILPELLLRVLQASDSDHD